MSDISSSSSSTSQRSPPVRRCRKTKSRIYRGSGKTSQAKRNSSCGVVGTQSTEISSPCIPKASLSSPEDLEVDSILQSSSTDDDRDVSSSISSDNDEEDDEEVDNLSSISGIINITCDITKCNRIEDGHANDLNVRKYDIRQNVEEHKRISTASTVSTSSGTKISNLERLIRTHPVWFQPDLIRDDTTLLLQGKEDGVRTI